MKRTVLILVTLVLVAGCGGEKKAQEKKQPSAIAVYVKMGNLAVDPFAQMSLFFEGNLPKEQIQEKLDKVLEKYSMELNNSNRTLAGKTLTALRKELGQTEMNILEKMLTAETDSQSFDDAARRIATAMNQ